MMTAQQHAQHKRRKSIRHDQPRHFGLKKSIIAAVTKHEQQFRDGQLHENEGKDEKDARASRKALGLVDPKLSYRGGQNESSGGS